MECRKTKLVPCLPVKSAISPRSKTRKIMNDLMRQVAGLSPAKRELLISRLGRQQPVAKASKAIPHRTGSSAVAPLSFAQERLWFLDQLEPGSRAYNVYRAFQLDGPLVTAALEYGVRCIVQRHEVLRSVFVAADGKKAHVISTELNAPIIIEDLEGLNKHDQEGETQRLLGQHSQYCFDLTTGPLLKVILLRLGRERHILLLVVHHIVFDGSSMDIFLQELFAFYNSFHSPDRHLPEELPIQYADFAVWQRQRLEGRLATLVAYWRKRLAGAPSYLDLISDRPRPEAQIYNGAVEFRQLSAALSDSLRDLSRKESVTPFMLLLAAFNTLLCQYTGQEDILVGTPMSGRDRPELDALIGLFVNTLVLRTDLSGDPTLIELLQRVRSSTLEAYEHQDLPFEKLVDGLKLERSLSRSPLFQVMFSLQNKPASAPETGELKVERLGLARPTSLFDLAMTVIETQGNLGLVLEYNCDLFDRNTIVRMLVQINVLLEEIIVSPHKRISELSSMMVSGPERLLALQLPMEDLSVAKLFARASIRRTLDQQLMAGVKALSERCSASIEAVLLATWQALLWRLIRQARIVTSRLGAFSRRLPIRSTFDADSRYEQLVRIIHKQLRAAHQWEEYFVSDDAGSNLDSAFLPIRFDYYEPGEEHESLGVKPDALSRTAADEPYKLNLAVTHGCEGWDCALHYDSSSLTGEDIAAVAEQYVTLLRSAVDRPQSKVSELEVNSTQQQEMLRAWQRTEQSDLPPKCIQELFEEQVARTPDSEAVVYEGHRLAYEELNRRANQLAHYLGELGVGPEVPVALCLERGLEMVVGVLAILKAGGVYVPMDPGYPQERLTWMLEDTHAPAILTHSRLRGRLPAAESCIVELDTEWKHIAERSGKNPVKSAKAENAAYIIYTSGSTGWPKGVIVEHAAVARLFTAAQPWIRFGETDVVVLFHSYTFDVSVFEIWGALLFGGKLVVLSWIESRSPEVLYEMLHRCKVTVLCQTPSAFRPLLHALEMQAKHPSLSLRLLIFAGEALNPRIVTSWLEHHPQTEIVNMYGITETTVYNTYKRLTQTDIRRPARSPIGVAFPDQRMYLLNENLEEAGLWEMGEIYIGGAGLARGYLNRADLTAERFVPDLARGDPGARMYRTGDIARRGSDGILEFLGRMDDQVKVRGYRIELGEVERAVQEQAGVGQAAVVVKERAGGERHLVAYVEMEEGSRSEEGMKRVREGVKERLPEYMCPGIYVRVERLPRNASGKLDRRGLEEAEGMEGVEGEGKGEYVGPRNGVEAKLVEIWRMVLGRERVGVTDNFFEVGGDSIVGIQIVARARQGGLELTPKQLFQHQTVAELAQVVGQGRGVEAEQGEVKGEMPLTPIQRWFFQQGSDNRNHFNQAFLFVVRAETKAEWLEQALQALLEQHDGLRLRFEENGAGEWRQRYASVAESKVKLRRIDLSQRSGGEEEQEAALREAVEKEQQGLDIGRGPLMGMALIDLGEKLGRRLWLGIHHLAVDGVSWRIMLEDVGQWYEQLSRGEEIGKRAKTTSFKHWAEQLQAYGRSAEVEGERAYWAGEEGKRVEEVYEDYRCGGQEVREEGHVVRVLGEKETMELLRQAGKAYNTQVMDLLLSAMVAGLKRWRGHERVRVELEGHGREEVMKGVDLSRTVGWFTSVYPVVLEWRGGEEVGERVKRVKEQLRGIPQKGLGYGVLRYLGAKGGEGKRPGEGELLINYLGQFDQAMGADALLQAGGEGSGGAVSGGMERSSKVELNAMVVGGRLQMIWSYSQQKYRRETIAELAEGYETSLLEVIAHCISPEAGGFTPNDFAEFNWQQSQIGDIAAAILKTKSTSPHS